MSKLFGLIVAMVLSAFGMPANPHYTALADDPPTIYSIAHICSPSGYDLVVIVSNAWEDETGELYEGGELLTFDALLTDMDQGSNINAHSPDISVAVYYTGHPCR